MLWNRLIYNARQAVAIIDLSIFIIDIWISPNILLLMAVLKVSMELSHIPTSALLDKL